MSDIFKPISEDRPNATSGTSAIPGSAAPTGSTTPGTIYSSPDALRDSDSGEGGKAVLAGVLGGFASAIGYIVYSRLPAEQKDRLRGQARTLVESRVNELRTRFNL